MSRFGIIKHKLRCKQCGYEFDTVKGIWHSCFEKQLEAFVNGEWKEYDWVRDIAT